MLLLSASGVLGSRDSSCFATGRDSPVRVDSSAATLVAVMSLMSAGMASPALKMTISPGIS